MLGLRLSIRLRFHRDQGDKATGPVPSQMLNALVTTTPTTKMTIAIAIFRGVDFIFFSLSLLNEAPFTQPQEVLHHRRLLAALERCDDRHGELIRLFPDALDRDVGAG